MPSEYMDNRWIEWLYADRNFTVYHNYTRMFNVEADDPMPIAEVFYQAAVQNGLIEAG